MLARITLLLFIVTSLAFGQPTSPTTVVGADGESSGSGTVDTGADQDLACYQGAGTTIGPCDTGQILFSSDVILGATTGAAAMAFAKAGTVSAPAWTFGGDLDTGIFRIGADNFGVALGGVQMASWGGGQTMRVWDQTPTTGVTTLEIRGGAAQPAPNNGPGLRFVNNIGISFGVGGGLSGDASGKVMVRPSTLQGSANIAAAGFHASGTGVIGFTPTSPDGVPDTAFSRCAAGVMCIGTGGQGSKAGRLALDNSTPIAATDACEAQSIWADADYIYVCVASGNIKRAAISTWP